MIIKNCVQSMGGYMIEIENFDNIVISGLTYGGHSGSKKGIILENERWFLKYPKSTKSMDVDSMSYTTSPVSEYIGSHIYKLLGFDVHETILGIANGKVVVACKDFLDKHETILDYNSIKNDYNEDIERKLEEISSSTYGSGTELGEIEVVMNNSVYFDMVPDLETRFWDMFIIDAFISNNDRNDNNWGLVLNLDTMNLKVSPVYDNGASFYGKTSDDKMIKILNEDKVKQVFYESAVSAFLDNGKRVNPLKYIESMKNGNCNKALLRVFPKISLERIKQFFNDIPFECNGIPVLTKVQREYYFKSLEYKYKNVLLPIYEQLLERQNN